MTPIVSATELIEKRSVIVCVGAGGVGKTTTAAALALEAAQRGRRAIVVTIDPARRLSDALGLEGDSAVSDEPRRIAVDAPGEMWAAMLDASKTFDALIRTYARSEEQATNILTNRFYQNITHSMGGAHEYMAMEKLYELHNDDRFDLVIVDTPPTTNAVEFLEAPDRITTFFDHRLYKILVTPTGGLARAVNFAAQGVVRTVSKIVGASVVDDVIEFFASFDGMEDGFRARAVAVRELLTAEDTAFALVTVPRRDTLDGAIDFVDHLAEANIAIDLLVVNRVHPRFTQRPPDVLHQELGRLAATAFEGAATALSESVAIADAQHHDLASLTGSLGQTAVVTVPYFDTDVHDLAGLRRITAWLGDSAGDH